YEAVLAALAILIWHIYYVVLDPDVYPMDPAWITGKSTRIRRRRHGDEEDHGDTDMAKPGAWRDWLSPVVLLSSNLISAAGVVLVTAAAVFWLVLLFSNAGHDTANPYLGILLFMVLPGVFFAGLALIPLGIWWE